MVLKMGPLSICVIVSESLSLCELGCLMCRRAGVTGTLHTAVPGVNHEAGCGPKLMLSKGQEQDRWGPLPGRADILGWGGQTIPCAIHLYKAHDGGETAIHPLRDTWGAGKLAIFNRIVKKVSRGLLEVRDRPCTYPGDEHPGSWNCWSKGPGAGARLSSEGQ